MKSLEELLAKLSEPKKLTVKQVLADVVNDCHPGRLEKLDAKLELLKEQIDRTNKKREGLSQRLQEVQELNSYLTATASANGFVGNDVLVLKMLLDDLEVYLKEEVEILRPTHRLKQKFDLTKFIYKLKQRKDVGERLRKNLSIHDGDA